MAKRTTAQKLKNPAWRSKISDSQLKRLSPSLYQKRVDARRVKEENATLYNPGAMLSGNTLRRAVNSLVDAETRPAMASLDRDIATTKAQGTEMNALSNSSFDRVAQNMSGLIAHQDANNVTSAQRMGQIAADTQAAIGAPVKNLLPGGDTPEAQGALQQLAAQQADAQGRAAQLSEASRARGAQMSQDFSGLMTAMAGASQMQRGEAARSINDKTLAAVTDLQGKRSDLVTSRGALRSKYTQDLRQQMFTNQATVQGLNLDMAQFQAKQADIATDNQRQEDELDLRRDALDYRKQADQTKANASAAKDAAKINQYGYRADDWARLSTSQRIHVIKSMKGSGSGSGSGGTKPATAPQRNDANTQIQYALSQLRRTPKGTPRSAAGSNLLNGVPTTEGVQGSRAVPQLYAAVALDMWEKGYVSTENAKRLHSMGLTLQDLGLTSYTSKVRPGGRRRNQT